MLKKRESRLRINEGRFSMSSEENKAIVRRTIEAINKQNLSLCDDLVAPDFVDHTRQVRGLEVLKQFVTMIYKSFSNFHVTIEDMIGEEDKVWIRVKITGTHTGGYRGLAPTGKKFTEASVWIYRIVKGKVVEGWNVDDELDFLKQLGVIEYKGFSDEDVS